MKVKNMAKYIIKQHNSYNHFHEMWSVRYVIYKKRWYGWSQKAITDDINEVKRMADNLIKQGNLVLKHWTITQDI